MAELSVRTDQITISPIRVMVDLAAKMTGDITRLHAGEPDFNTPEPVIRAAQAALDAGWTKYTSTFGILPLREEIARYDAPKLGRKPDPATEIMVTLGGTNSLFLAVFATLNPGDEVLVPDPGWPPYTEMVRLTGAVPISYTLDPANGFQLDRDSIARHLSVRTKAMLINSPNNPTGMMLSADDLTFLAQVARERNLWVISDEVYEKIVFDGRSHVSIAALPGMAERTVVISSFSKTWAMTGWRIGHLIAPAALVSAAGKLQGCVNSCPASFVQMAAIRALQMLPGEIETSVKEFEERRDMFVSTAAQIPGVECVVPQATFFILMDVSKLGPSDVKIAEHLLHTARVTSVPGSGFGANGSGFLRFSVVRSPEEIHVGLSKVKEALGKLPTPVTSAR